MKTRRMCAVCGDKTQSNVKLQWKRTADNMTFHVCLACAEVPNKVNADSVKAKITKSHTTVVI